MTQRQTKTPAQRAQEALDVADRRVKRLEAEVDKHNQARNQASRDLEAAVKRRDYLAANPDLPQTSAPTNGSDQ